MRRQLTSLAAFGSASLLAWILTATGALLLALVFARLGRAYPKTGGPYAYARRAFGDFVGFQTAWGYWIAVWAGNAAIAVAFVSYLGYFWPALGDTAVLAAAVALAAIWALTAVNIRGVRQGGLVQLVTTIAKLLPLVALAIAAPFFIDAGDFTPFNPSDQSAFGAVTAAASLTLWAFIGIESATVPAEDVRDPERTIPRATVIGTIVTAAVYILGTVAVFAAVPRETLVNSTAPFADAARPCSAAGRAPRSRSGRSSAPSARSTAGSCSRDRCRWPRPATACSLGSSPRSPAGARRLWAWWSPAS